MDKERFSLLLLEPGETYFEDFSVYCYQRNVTDQDWDQKKNLGRLKLCSKSIVFDPRDVMLPLIKIALRDCVKISEWKEDLTKSFGTSHVLAVESKQHVLMLAQNIIAPYNFVHNNQTFLFALNYVSLNDVLGPLGQLHRASSLPAGEQNSMIATIIFSRQKRFSFDPLWMEDLSEKVIVDFTGSKISPLVNNPGRIRLTNMNLYFQPFNNIEKTPVLKIRLKDIRSIVKRRFLLRQLGLEVTCVAGVPIPQLYLALNSPEDRDQLDGALHAQELSLEESGQAEMTLQWQNGIISNYDYLLFLNSQADRSFSDLTQYPVFPWIVADTKSETLDLNDPLTFRDLTKPVGALNSARLQRLIERYDEMDPPKFLYGSHYSAPGLVLFYLVRCLPHLMLCLQNGKFDHPDRMFNSMKDVWKNVNTSMADFKELIPEFYNVEKEGQFCTNIYGINFGYRHDGIKVGDVELPPWAQGSPKTFVTNLREALESDFVSKNIHHWIDLIFGCKQTGLQAEKAHNVFYPMCYEGKVDLTAERDFSKRHALEVQIMEFGQIPRQLFITPHPARCTLTPQKSLRSSPEPLQQESSVNESLTWGAELSLSLVHSVRAHREAVSSVVLSGHRSFSVGHDGVLKVFSDHNEVLRSANLSNLALSCCLVLPDNSTVLAGSWDNHISSYQVEYGRGLDLLQAHEDAVTCIGWTPGLLVSGSWDCSVRLWKVDETLGKQPLRASSAFLAELEHNDRVSCLDLTSSTLVSGTEGGEVQLWDIATCQVKQQLKNHAGKVLSTRFSPDGRRLICGGEDSCFKVIDLSSGMMVYNKETNIALRSLCWDGNTLLLGGAEGSLIVWDLVQVREVGRLLAHQGAVTAVALDSSQRLIVTGSEDRTVKFWSPF